MHLRHKIWIIITLMHHGIFISSTLAFSSPSYLSAALATRSKCCCCYAQIKTAENEAVVNDDGDAGSGSGESIPMHTWDVYVSQSSSKNKEKGILPSSSIIEAFVSLSPPDEVRVYPANWKKQGKSKGKGHTVRCIQRIRSNNTSENNEQVIQSAFEVTNIDSVDKVYHIITKHMKLNKINPKACECLTCYFQGNERLQDGTPSQAISLYNRALSTARETNTSLKQSLPQGSILLNRARAYLKRASNHRKLLRLHVKDLSSTIPDTHTLKILYQTSLSNPSLAPTIFTRLTADSKEYQNKFRSIRYRHDMYEFSLLHAARDALQSTQLIPNNAHAWMIAGECLEKLRKLKESCQYYTRAVELDNSLEGILRGRMDRMRSRMEVLEGIRGSGALFSGDTLRLALDVAED